MICMFKRYEQTELEQQNILLHCEAFTVKPFDFEKYYRRNSVKVVNILYCFYINYIEELNFLRVSRLIPVCPVFVQSHVYFSFAVPGFDSEQVPCWQGFESHGPWFGSEMWGDNSMIANPDSRYVVNWEGTASRPEFYGFLMVARPFLNLKLKLILQ